MVTTEILFNEIISGSYEYTRKIKREPVLAEENESDLVTDQIEEVLMLLNEYKDLVAWNLQQMGNIHLTRMKLVLKNDPPVVHRSYRITNQELEQVWYIVEELKAADIVEDSESPYASSILLVKKKMVISIYVWITAS